MKLIIKNLLKYTLGLPILLVMTVVYLVGWIALLFICFIGGLLTGDYAPLIGVSRWFIAMFMDTWEPINE